MTGTVTIPTWFFILLLIIFVLVLISKLLVPSVRWFFRKKLNRAINELNQRLNVQIRPFQLTKRQVLLDRLIHDAQVLDFVQQQAVDDDVPREVLMEKVQKYAREIVPSFNAYIYYRFGYWLAKKLAKLLYRVQVNTEQNKYLKNIAKDATVVFVMNHRSNMDYVLVSFLVAEKMAISYAVGEWARVWPLQGLIKSMGAYFVRRNSRNPLYRKVLERYIDMATREGVCQAVFPEGGLSKDGMLRPPKLGFLDYMLRNYHFERDRDVVFVPVGINYDRVLEDRTLLLSINPQAEKKSRWFAIKTTLGFIWNNFRLARKHRWNRFGFASVNFSNAISVRSYCQQRNLVFDSLDKEQRFIEIKALVETLMDSVEEAIPAVPFAIVSATLLEFSESSDSKGIPREQLEAESVKLMEKMEEEGARLVFPRKNSLKSVQAAIDRLWMRHLITINDDDIFIVEKDRELIEYYANSIDRWAAKPNRLS